MTPIAQALPYLLGGAGILLGAAAVGVVLLLRHARRVESAHGPRT
ncbi:hypothetical protein [Crenobacter intestini]|nr:hypothetical protein [Crenobacter intestini]